MDKSPDAFRTISEVADLLETPAHVLRFWESRFPQIKPVKRAGGRRYYRPSDVALLSGIRRLLHDEGVTIRGVQKILREQGVRHVSDLAEDAETDNVFLDEVDEDAAVETVSSDPIVLFPTSKPVDEPPAVPSQDEAEPEVVRDEEVAAEQPDPAPVEAPELDATDGPFDEGVSNQAAQVATPDDVEGIDEDALEQALSGPLVEITDDTSDDLSDVADAVPAEPVSDIAESEDTASIRTSQFPFDGPFKSEAVPADVAIGESLPDGAGAADSGETSEPDMAEAETEGHDLAASLLTENSADTEEMAEASDQSEEASASKRALPDALPLVAEITGHWLPADLRALRRGDLEDNRASVVALLQRLEALRNRVGDLGRVPRR